MSYYGSSIRGITTATTSSLTTENLPPRTIARLVREVRDLVVRQQQQQQHQQPQPQQQQQQQQQPQKDQQDQQHHDEDTTANSSSHRHHHQQHQQQVDQQTAGTVEGIRLIVDLETGLPSNLGELMAELEGPVGTPYEGKFFHFKLLFCHQYPVVAPRGFFLTKIYHPNVDMSTGAICVNTLKKDWTSSTTLSHVLNVIRCLLIVPFPESSLNDEAGRLFMESYTEYFKRAKLMADVHGRTISYYAQVAVQQQRSNNNINNSSEAVAENSSTTNNSMNKHRNGDTNTTNSTNSDNSSNNDRHYRSLSSSSSSDNPLQLSSSYSQNKVPTSTMTNCPKGVLNSRNGCGNDNNNPNSNTSSGGISKLGTMGGGGSVGGGGAGGGVGNKNRSNNKNLSTNKQKSKSLKRL